MRYVKARQKHLCAVCKEVIKPGEVCIQSQGWYHLFYHENCHKDKFGDSTLHYPKNERPTGE